MKDQNGFSPGVKLLLSGLISVILSIPLFAVYLLVYDRQQQAQTAKTAISQGWGGPQKLVGPLLVIPYDVTVSSEEEVAGKKVTTNKVETRELFVSPEVVDIKTAIAPEIRKKSIYEAVVYGAHTIGTARFALPADLARYQVDPATLKLDKAELRFGVADPRGLYGPPPMVTIDGAARQLQPGKGPGETGGSGFYTWLDASSFKTKPLTADFAFDLRGNESIALVPRAGDTRWTVTSPWPDPSFQGGFLPAERKVTKEGFTAVYRVGNLALGRALVATGDDGAPPSADEKMTVDTSRVGGSHADAGVSLGIAQVALITPVDLYDQVNRSVKYGFLFIGFTFLAFLMFELIGGANVSPVEYLLVGAGLILFFVMLLAFAEAIGFGWAYLVAAGAIVGLLTAYSAAVLASRKRAGFIFALLAVLYTLLFILLSLEAYSLLIGSVLIFVALAAVMYVTRNIDWGGRKALPPFEPMEAPAA